MSWEHLQDVWRKVHNKRVKEHFRDFINDPDDDDAWNNFIGSINLNIPRQSLCLACLQSDNDTADMTILRTLLFWLVLGQASALHPPLYTMPTDRYQQQVKFAPQITLYFKEDSSDVEDGYAPIDAEISFRLKNETYETITRSELQTVASKLRTEFATGAGYRWKKGRTKLSYRDLDNGYLLSINAFSETEGREVINKVLDIQGHTLDLDKLSIQQLAETPPIVPPTRQILGKTRRLPRRRPVGYVRFIYAEAHIWSIPEGICLLDRSGRRKNPVLQL